MRSLMAGACPQAPEDKGGSENKGGSASGGSGSGSGSIDNDDKFQGVITSHGTTQEEIDAEGGEREAGDYRVDYIVEPAEGRWDGNLESLAWRDPAPGETNHIEILPSETGTGPLIPYLEGPLTVLNEAGEEVHSKPLVFYRREFYHYANNFSLPQSGTYTLRAEMEPTTFLCHETEDRESRVLTEPFSRWNSKTWRSAPKESR